MYALRLRASLTRTSQGTRACEVCGAVMLLSPSCAAIPGLAHVWWLQVKQLSILGTRPAAACTLTVSAA